MRKKGLDPVLNPSSTAELPLTNISHALAIPRTPPQRVVIFSGHMIDAPDRPVPRFPSSKENEVRQRIAEQLKTWGVGPGTLGISGAARGGDLLFAELCVERGAEVWLFLPRPLDDFLKESVWLPGGHWVERFYALCSHARVRRFFKHELGDDVNKEHGVHARNNLWIIDTARKVAPNPDRICALVVWDKKPTGDGPGGTSDFVARVQQLGGQVAPPINPLE